MGYFHNVYGDVAIKPVVTMIMITAEASRLYQDGYGGLNNQYLNTARLSHQLLNYIFLSTKNYFTNYFLKLFIKQLI